MLVDRIVGSGVTLEKSAVKRDGPVFFSSAPVKVAGDERIYIVIFGGAGSLESGAFALSCLLAFFMVIQVCARKAPDSSQITPNHTKSK
jgi:hypothetical protein